MKGLRACWTAARERGDLQAGEHTFILGWTIRVDGTVTDAELAEPTEEKAPELARCMNAAVETWTFPAGSPRESIVRRFPLGPVKVR